MSANDEGFLVIVHPGGKLDDPAAVHFWTEVPALAACSSEGSTVEAAVSNTRRAITSWLAARKKAGHNGTHASEHAPRVRVEYAT